ncbi:MAG: hypothetical protein RLZZ238_124 [Planctomycetota bacterium]|jgi:anti-sigma B factor antagonist
MSELPPKKKSTHIELEFTGKLLYVRFIGPQVGQREVPIISQEVEAYLRTVTKDLKHFIIDMGTVTFMSSMGVGICIAFRNRVHAVGAMPIMYRPSAEMLKLLAMMKIDQMYKIAKDQAELDKLLRS